MIPPAPSPIGAAAGGVPTLESVRAARLRQAQKLEALGRLTGGIAHDFNNLLAVVIGSTETLSRALETDGELGPVARMALDAAERGAELVGQLLGVARHQPPTPESIDCGAFLGEMGLMLQRILDQAIQVRVLPPEAPLRCLADRTQLTSAVLNLAVNARDAMRAGGGALTLAAVRRRGAGNRDEALIVVRDTGEGMTPEVLRRATEPFFTTKPDGAGAGLGLSMVSGFARQSHGRLEIVSAQGRGCEARLFLPCAEALQAVAAAG